MVLGSGLMTTGNNEWGTPRRLYDFLNERFHFTLDPCATKDNALCDRFYTQEDDGLSKSWKGESVFMNPPYGKDIPKWVEKAYQESLKGALVVGLVPARTDTLWWHKSVEGKAIVFLVKGRLKYVCGDHNNKAPFPSAILIWWGGEKLNDTQTRTEKDDR